MTSRSLWNYYRDEVNDDANENNAGNFRTNNNKTITSKDFKYKTKIRVITPDDNNTLDTEVIVPLKYFNNFWRSLDLPLFNSEIELDLSWLENSTISQTNRTLEVPVRATSTCNPKFQINNANLYVPVVTSSINDNIKFLENIKQGFKRTISWNNYRCEIKT